jgi:phage terminase large subunit GpA-like protein
VVNELVTMLHEVFAVATDTGGQTEEEAQVVFDRAKLLLSEHGVEV